MNSNKATPDTTQKFLDTIQAAPSDELIGFRDYDRRRTLLMDSVKQAAIQRFPLQNEKYSIHLEDVDYADDKTIKIADQKKAILKGGNITKQLKGRFVLKDVETGAVVEKGTRRVLANVPYLTSRGTFIRNGGESVVINQIRMKPGAYSKKTDDGKYETLVNVKHGTGTQFKLAFDPIEAKFMFKVGGRKLPAYPIFNAMGITDEQLQQAWGKDIFEKNKVGNMERAMQTANDVFVPNYNKGK